ncbi:MAG TPA: 4Fe-4S binding protein [Anaeromyxobacteraceae bacterium]|nr:4Fe-4S binding protein [Anaeromyxobacteraceae bacterium]
MDGGPAAAIRSPRPLPGEPEEDMANKISEDCTSCGACEAECPNQAIAEGPDHYMIDPAKCDECKANGGDPSCMAVCPSDCIAKA